MATPQFSFRATPETVDAIDQLQALLAGKRGGQVSKAEAINYAVLRAVEDLKAGGTAVDRMTVAQLQASIPRARREAELEVLRQCQEHWASFMSRYMPGGDNVKTVMRAAVGKSSDKPGVVSAGIGGPLAQMADRHHQPSELDDNRKLAIKGVLESITAHRAEEKTSPAAEAAQLPTTAEVASRLITSLKQET